MKAVVVMPLAEQRGGGELMLWHLVQNGRGQGVDWHIVFTQSGPMVEQVRSLGIPATVIEAGRMRDIGRFALTVRALTALLRREKIDIVIGWMGTGHLYGGMAAKLAGIPAAWYQLGIPLDKGTIDRIATRLPARGIVACSKAGAAAQEQIVPYRPVRVVYPGVELDRFDPNSLPAPAAARQKLGLPTAGPLVGIVGRLQRWKGMHVLIEAMPRILEGYPDAHAVIVGGHHAFEPEYPKLLEEKIAERGLANQVTLAGLQHNIPEWMQAMDVVVHASDREPFGIVVIEAMALAKPVIATDTAGPTEIISDGVNGLLTRYGDAEGLADAICRHLADPVRAETMGQAARARALEFSVDRYAEGLIRAFRDFAGTSDSSGATAVGRNKETGTQVSL